MSARRRRLRPWKVGLDARTEANLQAKAKAHGVSRPEYVRALINAERPGARPGSEVALADAWWDSRGPARRVSVWRNHTSGGELVDEDQGQATIFEVLPPEERSGA